MEENTGFMDKLAELVANFDIANILPELDSFLGWMELLIRLAVMAGPLLVLIFGCIYFFMPPKEANHKVGFRTWFGMGSEEAWKFTQRLAGVVWGALGIVLLVMAIIVSLTFGGKDVMQIASSAFICLIWQAGLAVIGGFTISFIVFLRYDSLGYKRKDT